MANRASELAVAMISHSGMIKAECEFFRHSASPSGNKQNAFQAFAPRIDLKVEKFYQLFIF
ncbi:hypothetical protein [Bartonella apihabitans]|uniref:hypothetical protein n=1 Tax=Bartonella apihabitans TaxID=2750929 RepID=UPI003BB7AB1E